MKRDSVVHSFIIIYFARLLRQRVAYFHAESNSIFENFLRQLLNIFIQIKWIVVKQKNTTELCSLYTVVDTKALLTVLFDCISIYIYFIAKAMK